MRYLFVFFHRWVGLIIAAFLFVTGLTGAVISWDHELDSWLNPELHMASGTGPAKPSLDLATLVEARDPRVRVARLPLQPEPGEALEVIVFPKVDPATGRLFEPGYNQVFLNPVTGAELGRRERGQAWPITRQTLVSFLYKLHYSLHVPEMWGIDRWGIWFMGGIAIAWMIDCFVGFYLTLPARKTVRPGQPLAVRRALAKGWWRRWKPAWKVKTSGSAYRINFDLHRAFSLWTWGVLILLAFTAFSLNLYRELFYPVMSTVSQVTPLPFDLRRPATKHRPIEPSLTYAQVLDLARAEGGKRGWTDPVGALAYNQRYGIYSARFFQPGDDHGAAGVGPAMLFYDGKDGRYLGDRQPWVGTAADIFVQAQFPIHSGRLLGLPGRILISLMGLVVAMLSVTGVVIWWRKRAARISVRQKAVSAESMPAPVE
ncbi:PepSY domain-containing protein [Methylobacterium sp. R2-1]|uniref:PepSY-associated TM helix domain-containing protein n=1 Tax=Methylobacterium sp. R2-1 TaxID=2587064 RepID=UPI001613EA59|nr:PepSY-associated TM helix domain-containing protein [Methylobacterium sp. R2-1]MBB2965065.1 putative iron-regulated membrane protein [Methylobacterium sp. R2-1]